MERILDLIALGCAAKRNGGDPRTVWLSMSTDERVAFDLHLVRVGSDLAWQAGPAEDRFADLVARMCDPGVTVRR